ncbi:MAG: thioredoxin domain-containing protein [Trueperaceae bacterium]|nr:thioredoxin domain-containing protein [Trueperaceae bacterium]
MRFTVSRHVRRLVPRTVRTLAAALALAFALVPVASAQAIGDRLETFLDASGAVAVDDGAYRLADLSLAVRAPNDVLAQMTLTGVLDDQGVRDAAAALAIATGYGAGIEEPIATYLREQAPALASSGPVTIGVEAYALEIDLEAGTPPSGTLSLSLPTVSQEAFGTPVATLGADDAAVMIRVFSDFQCPFCQRYALEIMPSLEASVLERDDVGFAFHHFPLTSIHANAVPAAEAAQCVSDHYGADAFWAYHDLLFERLDAWKGLGDPAPYFARVTRDVEAVAAAASEANDGVDLERAADVAAEQVGACLANGDARATVRDAAARARALNLSGTPTVFVGDYRLNDFGSPQAYARLVRLQLAERGDALGPEMARDADGSAAAEETAED